MEVLIQTDGGTDGQRGGGCGAGSAVGQRQRSSGRSLMRVNQLSCVAAGSNISDAEAKGAATLGVILQVALYCKSIHTHAHTLALRHPLGVLLLMLTGMLMSGKSPFYQWRRPLVFRVGI